MKEFDTTANPNPLKFTFNAKNSRSYTMAFWMFVEDHKAPFYDTTVTPALDEVITVSMNNVMQISVGWHPDFNYLDSKCFIHTYAVPHVTTETKFTNIRNYDAAKGYVFSERVTNKDISGMWIYYRCSYSLDLNKMYNMMSDTSLLDDAAKVAVYKFIETTGIQQVYSINDNGTTQTSVSVDYPFHYAFPSGNMDVQVKIPSSFFNLGYSIFMKNLYLYTEYIPIKTGLQYYNFAKLAKNDNFPGFLGGINFDNYILKRVSGVTYSSTYTFQFDFTSYNRVETPVALTIRTVADAPTGDKVTFGFPKNFYRLSLDYISDQTAHLTADLIFDTPIAQVPYYSNALTCDPTKNYAFCWRANVGIACKSGYFYNYDDDTCTSAGCKTGYLPNYGSVVATGNSNKIYTGFCTINTSKNNIATSNANFNVADSIATLTCNAGFTKMYLSCIPTTDQDNGALFFSGSLNPKTLSFTVNSAALTSYYVEFWIFIDSIYTPYPENGATNYLLWAGNKIKIHRVGAFNLESYKLTYDLGTQVGSDMKLKYANWYKIAYEVRANKVILHTKDETCGDGLIPDTTGTTVTDGSLQYINFVQGIVGTNTALNGSFTIGATVNWYSAFYKDIKVFNLATDALLTVDKIKRIYSYFPYGSYLPSLHASLVTTSDIKYPSLNLNDITTNSVYSITSDYSPAPNQQINFSVNFDTFIPKNKRISYTYDKTSLTTKSIYPVNSNFQNCADVKSGISGIKLTNCEVCNHLECLRCSANFILDSYEGVCKSTVKPRYFLRLPTYNYNSKTTLKDLTISPFGTVPVDATVAFYFKYISKLISTNVLPIMTFGATYTLKYEINPANDNKDYLRLYLADGSTKAAEYDCTNDFTAGKWVFVSLSYSQNVKVSSTIVYPAQVSFQINNQSFDRLINPTADDGLLILPIVIKKEFVGVLGKLAIWNQFIIGSLGLLSEQKYEGFNYVFSFGKLTSLQCINDLNGTFNPSNAQNYNFYCALEDINATLIDNDNYCPECRNGLIDTTITKPACVTPNPNIQTCPYGYFNTYPICTCKNTADEMWIIDDGTYNLCKKVDYFDFNRVESAIATNVFLSKTEFSLETWVYYQPYTGTNMSAFYIFWDKQLSIKIYYASGTYKADCMPFDYLANTRTGTWDKTTVDITFPKDKTITWVHVRCSIKVSTSKHRFFAIGAISPSEIPMTQTITSDNITTTTLTITPKGSTPETFNNINYGVVFIRQLKLWKCYACKDINTFRIISASSALYNSASLANLWDPYMNSYNKVNPPANKDGVITSIIGGINLVIKVDATWRGMNKLVFNDHYKYLNMLTQYHYPEKTTDINIYTLDLNSPADTLANGEYIIDTLYFSNKLDAETIFDYRNGRKLTGWQDVNINFLILVCSYY